MEETDSDKSRLHTSSFQNMDLVVKAVRPPTAKIAMVEPYYQTGVLIFYVMIMLALVLLLIYVAFEVEAEYISGIVFLFICLATLYVLASIPTKYVYQTTNIMYSIYIMTDRVRIITLLCGFWYDFEYSNLASVNALHMSFPWLRCSRWSFALKTGDVVELEPKIGMVCNMVNEAN